MSLARNIREQLLKSFRAELAEHIQTMTDSLLALEQGRADSDTMDTAFRAAHSLKGAARAMGVTAIEQVAHSLENLLDGLRRGTLAPHGELFTACYHALDAIQLVQSAYEAGETTPPTQVLIVLSEMEKMRTTPSGQASASIAAQTTEAQPAEEEQEDDGRLPAFAQAVIQPAVETPAPMKNQSEPPAQVPPPAVKEPQPAAERQPAVEMAAAPVETPIPGNGGSSGSPSGSNSDETVRVDVQKLDELMANLSELLVARIRLEQRQAQIHHLQEMLNSLQKNWSPVRGSYNRLTREQTDGILSLHRPRSVDMSPHMNGKSTRSGPRNGFTMDTALNFADNASEVKHLTEVSKDAAQLLRYVGATQEHLRSLSVMVGEMSRQYSADTMHLSLVIDELENEIKSMRMLPFNTITGVFARMIRDLARQSGKEATLTILGGNTEVDKRILEGIKDPLMHLLRNAVDHGIEKPEKRQVLGKARTGQITLSAEQIGKDVVIRVSDDGAGLDLEAIRQAVVTQNAKNGLSTNTALSEAELIDAIYNMGVSTSRIITDVSGRGVGLNVVRNNIEMLHGRIDLESKLGEGTTFTLTLPLALTGSRSLMIHCAGQLFAIPINTVERSLHIDPSDIFSLEGHDTIQYNGHPVPLVRLGDVLELTEAQSTHQSEDKRLSAVVLTIDERRLSRQVAFLVDDLVGEQEVVIKSLGKQLSRVGGISGATVLGSGEVALILNAADLMKLATRPHLRSVIETLNHQAVPQERRSHKRVLVVDDSITTRTLEKNILEAAGYTVILATNGVEALGIIRSTDRPDLVVTDIVMPRMDGFELTRQIKEDSQTKMLPVILVTSLDSQEDKEHGIEVQADAYIVKSSFDQVNLLDTIEQLI